MDSSEQAILWAIKRKYESLCRIMDERTRRRWGALEAMALGEGGTALVAQATDISRATIERGISELRDPAVDEEPGRIRKKGGGRKPLTQSDSTLLQDLEALVGPSTRGDPMSPLRWTAKSTSKLCLELRQQGHQVGERTVAHLLHELDYSLQANAKTREGKDHPDRDSQFKYISSQVTEFQSRGQPIISVDTKKKELVGNFKNPGKEWEPKGRPQEVNTHDFPDPDVGKGIPYGVYDQIRNAGWVSVGIDHDTAEFAVHSIRTWWKQMGNQTYPNAKELLITADAGGSNSYRVRLWKRELQAFADEQSMKVTVCHFPPGTSKWNKIEHRMFSEITKNWRGKPLTSHEVIVNLIANTTTSTGLQIKAGIDRRRYAKGRKVTKKEMAELQIRPHTFHGEWNYTVDPRA